MTLRKHATLPLLRHSQSGLVGVVPNSLADVVKARGVLIDYADGSYVVMAGRTLASCISSLSPMSIRSLVAAAPQVIINAVVPAWDQQFNSWSAMAALDSGTLGSTGFHEDISYQTLGSVLSASEDSTYFNAKGIALVGLPIQLSETDLKAASVICLRTSVSDGHGGTSFRTIGRVPASNLPYGMSGEHVMNVRIDGKIGSQSQIYTAVLASLPYNDKQEVKDYVSERVARLAPFLFADGQHYQPLGFSVRRTGVFVNTRPHVYVTAKNPYPMGFSAELSLTTPTQVVGNTSITRNSSMGYERDVFSRHNDRRALYPLESNGMATSYLADCVAVASVDGVNLRDVLGALTPVSDTLWESGVAVGAPLTGLAMTTSSYISMCKQEAYTSVGVDPVRPTGDGTSGYTPLTDSAWAALGPEIYAGYASDPSFTDWPVDMCNGSGYGLNVLVASGFLETEKWNSNQLAYALPHSNGFRERVLSPLSGRWLSGGPLN